MKTVLCYGDSNTYGFPPLLDFAHVLTRYGIHERWAGVMRDQLGDGYHVVEEGLGGRNTVFDDPVEGNHRNGRTYLLPCLETVQPVDLVIFMLGTNDLKARFSAPTFDIVWGMNQLASFVLSSSFGANRAAPQVLIIAPVPLGKLTFFAEMLEGGHAKSLALRDGYKDLAQSLNCGFLDAAEYVNVSDIDGVHFDASEHKKLGIGVAQKVKEMLP